MCANRAAQNLNDAVALYVGGVPMGKLRKDFSVSYAKLKSALGIHWHSRQIKLPEKKICAEYLRGVNEKPLAEKYGVSRSVIARVLLYGAVKRRSNGDAQRINHRNDPGLSARQTKKAHDAVRGVKKSVELLERRAQHNQRALTGSRSIHEERFKEACDAISLSLTQQFAVGKYNCDFAAPPIAVEIWGGNFHFYGRHMARTPEKFHKLADANLALLVLVVCKDADFALLAQKAHAFSKEVRRNPTLRGQYRVIGCAGQLKTCGSLHDDDLTLVKTLRSRKHSRDGH